SEVVKKPYILMPEFYAHSIDFYRGDCPRLRGANRSPRTCHCEGQSPEAISAVRGRLRIGTVPA
ncbi:MAG: hypothetical protein AAB264_00855, partial [Planctomycetota bacterium]